MQIVSDKYKEYIEKDVRNFSFNAIIGLGDSITSSQTSYTNKASISDANTVFNNLPFTYDYAYLQEDYFMLDGSFILPNRSNNKYTGFIASDHTCSLSFAKGTSGSFYADGLTICFGNGYAKNFTVSFYVYNLQTQEYELTGEKSYTDNDKDVVDVPRVGSYSSTSVGRKITITINEWSDNHFPIIKKILSYKGVIIENDDVNFKHLEETDLRGLSIPSNSLSLTLDNYDREYNILDNNNILNKLTPSTTITTYIGLDIDGAYEYLYLGRYYYKSYKASSDKTIELDFIGLAEWQNNNESAIIYSDNATYTPDQVRRQIFGNLSDDTNKLTYSGNIPCGNLPNTSKQEQQLEAMLYYNASVRQTKNNRTNLLPFNIDEINQGIEDYTIDLDRQIRNPEFTKVIKTKRIRFNTWDLGSESSGKTEIINTYKTYTAYQDNEYIFSITTYTDNFCAQDLLGVDAYWNDTLVVNGGIVVSGSGFSNFNLVYYGYHKVGFTFMSPTDMSGTFRVAMKTYPKIDRTTDIEKANTTDGAIIEITSSVIKTDAEMERISQMIFDYEDTYPFEFEIEIMGDTRLEVGDKIRIESLDGYHLAIIERIDTTYNGGLTQIIKGVSSGVLQ